MTEQTFKIAALALIALLATAQITSLAGESQTWDEGIHLVSGYAYLRTGTYEISPEHPPLGRVLAALPLLFFDLALDRTAMQPPAPAAGFRFLYRNRLLPDWMLNSARLMVVALSAAFAIFVAWWSHRRFGNVAGLISLALICLDPNITAHGRYVTTDLIASFAIFAAVALWIDAVEAPSLLRVAAAGVALGCALGSKNSALFLCGVLPLVGLARGRWVATAGMAATAIVTLGLIYAPELAHGKFSYVAGIRSLLEQNTAGEPGYLLGQVSNHGWWYYFPVAFAVKTPAGVLLALTITAFLVWRTREQRFTIAALSLAALVFFGACIMSHITIGHRHLLPLYGFLYAIAGAVLARRARLAALCVGILALESLAIYPHYLTFFNAAAGGPDQGARYLADSNLDWGQEAKRLGLYLAEHRLDRVCLAYFGNADLQRYGVEWSPMPRSREAADCVVAVSVTALKGLYVDPASTNWLQSIQPTARIGHAIYMYDLRKIK